MRSVTAGFDRECSFLMFLFKAGSELGYLGSLGRKVENAKQGQNAVLDQCFFAMCLIVFDAASWFIFRTGLQGLVLFSCVWTAFGQKCKAR